jgi:hypothetical protein
MAKAESENKDYLQTQKIRTLNSLSSVNRIQALKQICPQLGVSENWTAKMFKEIGRKPVRLDVLLADSERSIMADFFQGKKVDLGTDNQCLVEDNMFAENSASLNRGLSLMHYSFAEAYRPKDFADFIDFSEQAAAENRSDYLKALGIPLVLNFSVLYGAPSALANQLKRGVDLNIFDQKDIQPYLQEIQANIKARRAAPGTHLVSKIDLAYKNILLNNKNFGYHFLADGRQTLELLSELAQSTGSLMLENDSNSVVYWKTYVQARATEMLLDRSVDSEGPLYNALAYKDATHDLEEILLAETQTLNSLYFDFVKETYFKKRLDKTGREFAQDYIRKAAAAGIKATPTMLETWLNIE